MINWIKDVLSNSENASSKRLTMVLSYIVSLSLCIVAVVFHIPIEANVLTMLLGCCGISSGTYAMAKSGEKKEIKDAD